MKRKQGISLIVLVITIIVMIILASAVVITLSNNGIINRADEAVDKTSKSQIEHLAALAWADAYADGLRGAELKAKVEEILEANKITTDDWNIAVTDKGVTLIPKGEEVKVGLLVSNKDIGKTVMYEANGVSDWQLFYEDEAKGNIYLIAKGVPERTTLSTKFKVSDLTQEELDMFDLFQVVDGVSHTLIDLDVERNWSMTGCQGVARLIREYKKYMNTEDYGSYVKGALGGPTIELFAASWNAMGYEPQITLGATDWGYTMNGSWHINLVKYPIFFLDESEYWIASTNYGYQNTIMIAIDYYISSAMYYAERGIRPVVCISMDAPAISVDSDTIMLVKQDK
ncbi:MAG: type II secretion system protein [Clostridia bacterium]|nr:type II secretion system protein [Clostridia bacterium]